MNLATGEESNKNVEKASFSLLFYEAQNSWEPTDPYP